MSTHDDIQAVKPVEPVATPPVRRAEPLAPGLHVAPAAHAQVTPQMLDPTAQAVVNEERGRHALAVEGIEAVTAPPMALEEPAPVGVSVAHPGTQRR